MLATTLILFFGGGRVYDMYCRQPPGGDRDVLASLLGICHVVHLYVIDLHEITRPRLRSLAGAGGFHLRQSGDGRPPDELQGPAAEAGQHTPHPQVPRAHQPRVQPLLRPGAADQTVRPRRALPTEPHQDLQRTRQTGGGRHNMMGEQSDTGRPTGRHWRLNCWTSHHEYKTYRDCCWGPAETDESPPLFWKNTWDQYKRWFSHPSLF